MNPNPDRSFQAPCFCPGYGPNKTFTFVVTRDEIPNILVPGQTRSVVRVNGHVPGPSIVVDEHDWVMVHVVNAMPEDGTTIHWHGVIQQGTQYSDGVPALTQCLIPPGRNVTYMFRASLSGTFWYHGHYLEQYVDGLVGPLIVNRVAANGVSEAEALGYTSDFTLMIQDFYNNAAHYLVTEYYLTPNSTGNEPIPDAIVVNGKLSKQLNIMVSRSSKSRFRFVAANAFSMFNISIDGVRMLVIETDGTSTAPTPVAWFVLNVAQRVSVLVDWSTVPLSTRSVYIRITAQASMYPVNITDYVPWYDVPGAQPLNPNFLAIAQFLAGDILTPSYHGVPDGPWAPQPSDSNQMNTVPVDPSFAPNATHFMYSEIDFFTGANGVNYASFNQISSTPSGYPALYSYLSGRPGIFDLSSATAPTQSQTVFDHSHLVPIHYNQEGQYFLPYNAVVDVLVNNTDTGDHPIHKHSHPFWLIATSEWPEAATRNRNNYPRRDVVTVQAGGWAWLRFVADVPGVWAYHCHIDWHAAAGLFATIVEGADVLHSSGEQVPTDFISLCP